MRGIQVNLETWDKLNIPVVLVTITFGGGCKAVLDGRTPLALGMAHQAKKAAHQEMLSF